jgi:hypothetical protein
MISRGGHRGAATRREHCCVHCTVAIVARIVFHAEKEKIVRKIEMLSKTVPRPNAIVYFAASSSLLHCEEFPVQILAFYKAVIAYTFYTAIRVYIPAEMDESPGNHYAVRELSYRQRAEKRLCERRKNFTMGRSRCNCF